MDNGVTTTRRKERQDPRSDPQRIPVVYFFQLTGESLPTPLIKIGYTEKTVEERRQEIERQHNVHGTKVTALCALQASYDDEQKLHGHFKRDKFKGEKETFNPSERLVDYIRWMRDQYFVWVPDDDQCKAIELMEPVEFSRWMPGNGNSKREVTGIFHNGGELNLPSRQTSEGDDYYTHRLVIQAASDALGGIDLDPASHAVANEKIGAKRFFSIREDGLMQKWSGRVWLNPPFSRWHVWGPKVVEEWKSGNVLAMCVLAASKTITAHVLTGLKRNCHAVCILDGRFPFWGPKATSGPKEGHVIFYFGSDTGRFHSAFDSLGTVFVSPPERNGKGCHQ